MQDTALIEHQEQHGGGLIWDPGTHAEVDCLWVAGLRNMLLDPSLFVYLNTSDPRHPSWVLAQWKFKPTDGLPGVILELDAFTKHPDEMEEKQLPTPDRVRELLQAEIHWLNQAYENRRATEAETKRLKEEALRLRQDHVKFMRNKWGHKKGMEQHLRGIETGRVPWMTKELAFQGMDRKGA